MGSQSAKGGRQPGSGLSALNVVTCVLIFTWVSTHLSSVPDISLNPSQYVSLSSHAHVEARCCTTPETLGRPSDPALPGSINRYNTLSAQALPTCPRLSAFPLLFHMPPPATSPSIRDSPPRPSPACYPTAAIEPHRETEIGTSGGYLHRGIAVLKNKFKDVQDTSLILELITIKFQR